MVVFDLELMEDTATYEKPFMPPSGIRHVFINGQAVISSGKIAGLLPGKALRNR